MLPGGSSLAQVATNAATNEAGMPRQQAGATQSQAMDQMAQSLTSMAEMCKTMMQMEMKSLPLKTASLVIIGLLLTVALVLFVLLEIQWLRFWHRRNKREGP
jgi:hypothetical protein